MRHRAAYLQAAGLCWLLMMGAPGEPRVFYMGGALPMRWHINGP